jgi:hypothetical protein
MKKIAIFSFAALTLFACTKEKHEGEYKVKFSVTGTTVEQFKTSCGLTENNVATPFAGTRDTTIYVQAGTALKLDTKASSHEALSASIFVNDAVVATLTDADADNDSKTQVKIEYTIPVK